MQKEHEYKKEIKSKKIYESLVSNFWIIHIFYKLDTSVCECNDIQRSYTS